MVPSRGEDGLSVLKSVTRGMVEKFNPFHDEQGRFTSASGGEKESMGRSERELEQKHVDYIHANEKAGKTPGPRGHFLHYTTKAEMTGREPEGWKKLNTKIGNYEGMANAYIKRGTEKGAEGWQRKLNLARAETMRKASDQYKRQRDKIEVPKAEAAPASAVPKPEEKSMEAAKAKIHPLLAADFKLIEEAHGYSAEEESKLPPEEIKQVKVGAVKDAVRIGMITAEEGKEIIDGL
jgi:hypothetical protein